MKVRKDDTVIKRRDLLIGAGFSTVAATIDFSPTKLLAQSSTPNSTVYGASIQAHATAAGNALYKGIYASDWTTVQTTLTNRLNEWNANDRDAGVKAAVARISPGMITSANLDQETLLPTAQQYQSKFQLSDLQQILTFVDANQSLVPSVLSGIETYGMSYYISVAIGQASKVTAAITKANASGATIRLPSPEVTPHPIKPPGHEGGGGGYSCATDGALIFAAGLAFATLSVMTLGSVDVLAGAAWAGIGTWGGLGTVGWGAGHYVVGCGF